MNSSKIRHVVTKIVLLFYMTLMENEKCNQKLFHFYDFPWFNLLIMYCSRVQGMVSWVLESSKWALQNLYSKNLYEIKRISITFSNSMICI